MTLQATETLQPGPFQGIFDEAGAFVGFLNPRANGSDMRIGGDQPGPATFTTLTATTLTVTGLSTLSTLTVSGTSTLGVTRISGADASSPLLGVSGTTKGIRFMTTSGGASIEGVDNTLVGSYQPLIFDGSQHQFKISAGSVVMQIDSTQVSYIGGSAATPPITFGGDLDTGVCRISANILGLVAGGVAGCQVTSTGPVAVPATAIPAGGTTGSGYKLSSTANFGIFFGSGAPSLSAAKGSLYLRSDGSGTNDRSYINTDGGTTWTAQVTVA